MFQHPSNDIQNLPNNMHVEFKKKKLEKALRRRFKYQCYSNANVNWFYFISAVKYRFSFAQPQKTTEIFKMDSFIQVLHDIVHRMGLPYCSYQFVLNYEFLLSKFLRFTTDNNDRNQFDWKIKKRIAFGIIQN